MFGIMEFWRSGIMEKFVTQISRSKIFDKLLILEIQKNKFQNPDKHQLINMPAGSEAAKFQTPWQHVLKIDNWLFKIVCYLFSENYI